MVRTSHGLGFTLGVIAAGALASGCSEITGGGGGGGRAASASSAAVAQGPLHEKALLFDATIPARNTIDGLVQNVNLDAQGNFVAYGNYQDAAIWTGTYVGTQALRYRATNDPEALRNVERGLRAIHGLHAVTGDPGQIARAYAPVARRPNDFPASAAMPGYTWLGEISRDQYAGVMFGYSLAWGVITDPALRDEVRRDVRAIAERLIRDDMALKVVVNGVTITQFRLAPNMDLTGQITPHVWATIDDFPLNLITPNMPYDAALAQALEQAPWPAIGGGETLHGLSFLRVAATITGDPAIESYYRDELIARRGWLRVSEENATLLDDVLAGKDLHRIEEILIGLNHALSGAFQVYLQRKLGNGLSVFAGVLLQSLLDAVLREVADRVADAITFLNDPVKRAQAGARAAQLAVLAQVLDAIGERDAADAVRRLVQVAGAAAGADLDACADSMRSYVGENLFHLSAYSVLEHETDPTLRASYERMIAKHHGYIADERNSFFSYVAAARLPTSIAPASLADARESLARFPRDLHERLVDNTGRPGVTPSPWPDRFGRTDRNAMEVLWVDERAPHNFIWQQHPRQIRSGSAHGEAIAPLGYLAAYWMARRHGLIGPNE